MTICCLVLADGRVSHACRRESAPEGWVDTGRAGYPDYPRDIPDGQTADLFWDGASLEWRMVDKPQVPEIDAPVEVEPTSAEQESARAAAYRAEVDPITCQIQRLRDGPAPLSDAVSGEIAELMAERARRVAAIVERYPYPQSGDNADA